MSKLKMPRLLIFFLSCFMISSGAVSAEETPCSDPLECVYTALNALQKRDAEVTALQGQVAKLMSRVGDLEKVIHPLQGSVVAFELNDCPDPWESYEKAQGRFIRGADPTGRTDRDPDSPRLAGDIQGHALQDHYHSHSRIDLPQNDRGLPNKSEDNDGTYITLQTTGPKGASVDPQETRPVNVALTFCILR